VRSVVNARLGLTAALVAAASYGLMSYLVHWNPKQFPVEQMTVVRGLITMVGVLPFCWRDLWKYFQPDSLMLWLRAFTGATGLFLYYYTLQGTVSGNANFLFSSSPLFVSLLSWIFLKEGLTRTEMFGVALIVFANVLLYIPNSSSMPLWVWETGLAGAMVSSLAFLSLGSATKRYSSALIVFGFGAMSTVFAMFYPGRPWLEPTAGDWGYLVFVGVLGMSSQYLTTLSFAHLKNAIATSIGRTVVLFSGALDIALAGYRPHPLEWVSYLVIIAGVAFTQEKEEPEARLAPPA
jgi:drug/metabolite transporter (DMT)-like permease